MKIAVLVAMDKELSLLMSEIRDAEEISVEGIKVVKGHIGGHDVIVGKCGIGKVNAAMRTLMIIDAFHPDLVINTGVAGGAGRCPGRGKLVVGERVAYHDVWCGPGTDVGTADGQPDRFEMSSQLLEAAHRCLRGDDVAYGLICTGDRFISTAEEVAAIKSAFPDALAVDMESAAIAHACNVRNVPFGVLRVVSDTPGLEEDNINQYNDFWNEAPAATFAAVSSLLANI